MFLSTNAKPFETMRLHQLRPSERGKLYSGPILQKVGKPLYPAWVFISDMAFGLPILEHHGNLRGKVELLTELEEETPPGHLPFGLPATREVSTNASEPYLFLHK